MTPPEEKPAGLSLGQVAQIAEIVASLAVIITLVFLIAEVRQNTRITQAAAYERRMEDLNRWRAMLATEPELAELYIEDLRERGIDRGGEVDDFRLGGVLTIQWAIYENAYYSNQNGLLGESEWSRFERQICSRYDMDGDRWATGNVSARRLLTEEFAEYVEDSCE